MHNRLRQSDELKRNMGKATFNEAEKAAHYVLKKLDDNLNQFSRTFPGIHSDRLRYPHGENHMWAHGFWTGMSWLAYDLTGDDKYRHAAEAQLESYGNRFQIKVNGTGVNDGHEMGMVYVPSCVSAYKLTGNRDARQWALQAAELLRNRTTKNGMIYQYKVARRYRTVIDTVMNLPLLHWAYAETGDEPYLNVCLSHIQNVLRLNLRENGMIYHAVDVHQDTGEPVNRIVGFSPSSCWSRGMAWGIYGLALHYSYTSCRESLQAAIAMTEYYISRLPSDQVCCWDLYYTGEQDQRDSSASAIAVCGMLELLKHMDDHAEQKLLIEQAAIQTLQSLTRDYLSVNEMGCSGVLLHGVYNLPIWAGVDECCLWGDYFYFEALVRCLKDWNSYW
ncbi:glycoside hydrolase family 88 protein [Paenibacillus allorhizosphaerae]|uniref:Unsaturated chondroitin disaccharide hydrolase n=1 Tax=Paenibacillus allorhizosphaerae TaxID=2849866 RepID=A0ABM8VAQ1_9BACL|nr:glycoside hydrolase family 88 protein [Paenibacillus allorhizosphaerae]CAG7617062.1 Unsaturated chondroitin disaccharide hydrolase [Paenibacillus allorhizosphaerae]